MVYVNGSAFVSFFFKKLYFYLYIYIILFIYIYVSIDSAIVGMTAMVYVNGSAFVSFFPKNYLLFFSFAFFYN